MKKEDELKKTLIKIKGNKELPLDINYYELAMEMFSSIGTIDSVLRDNLILSILVRIIEEKKISYKHMKEILSIALSDEHLFNGLGRVQDDSVFNRTFTVLIVEVINNMNNEAEEPFMNKAEVLNVYDKVIEYAEREKDFRGFVEGKGWAHSTAHTADALCSLAESKGMGYAELQKILEVIKLKICVDTYTYINEEDERLINAFMRIYNRNIIGHNEIIGWLSDFKNIKFEGDIVKQEHLRENMKLFFRSLYFRCKKKNLSEDVSCTIEEVLDSLPAFY